ncbi:Calx-beta domain-containing protein [Bdellovibrio sp. HCB209]|uniref:Calx-beta domain-containing protein n=1 Tax=Bdellovibrio sp. HCB209 TaxID=3394354 RepID=UPI0039B62A70
MFRTSVFTLILGFVFLTGCGQLDAKLFGLDRLIDSPSKAAYPKVLSVEADVTNASNVGIFALPRFTTAQVVPISVNFSGPVDVTGTPTLELETGTTKRKANYASGSGTDTLVFEYSVVAGDSAPTLDYTGTTAIDLNGGTIEPANADATGTADEIANLLTLPAPGAANSLADTTPILVRTIPEVKELKAPDTDVYLDGVGLEVVVKYDQPVSVTGSPSITVKVGSNNRVANYIAQISSSELLFRYEIIVGDDDVDGVDLPAAITMTGATIVNPANEPAVTTLPAKDTSGVLTYTSALTAEFLSSSQIVSESAGDIYIPVHLNSPAPIPFKVAVQASGEATSDDYTLVTSELNFAIGEQSKMVHIKILDDSIAEPEKRIRLMLSKNSLGAGGVRAFHEIHINDDDGPVTPTVTDFRGFSSFWCALYSDKNLKCWGINNFGQLGNNTSTNNYTIPTTPTLTNVESFDVKQGTTVCAVRTGGEVWCWGRDNQGALSGSGSEGQINVPTKYINSGVKKVISLPRGHAFLDTAGDLWAWGTDREGLFSTSSSDLTLNYASRIKLMGSVQDFWVSFTGNFTTMCALNTSKDLYCWGDVSSIGLPMGVTTTQYRPSATPVASNVESFTFGRFFGAACVIKKNGATDETYCWGENYNKFIDPTASTTNNISTPTLLSSAYRDVMVTQQTICGIKGTDSSLWCWGRKKDLPDTEGQDGTSVAQKMIDGGVNKFLPNTYIDGASVTNCVSMTDGSVQCWGNLSTQKNQWSPILVKAGVAQVSLSRDVNYKHACAVTTSGAVDCWGKNASGQVGDRTTIDRVVPTESLARNQVQVSAARNATCSVSSYGEVRCWGFNESGAFGLGGAGLVYTSPQVLFSKDVKKVMLDERGGCALKNNGSLWCWGSNAYGQYQPGTLSSSNVPVEVKNSGVKDFTTRVGTTCLISDEDKLFCWGRTEKSATGQGPSSSPVLAIPTTPILEDVASVAIGGDGYFASGVCAVKTNGDMHCWGQSSGDLDLGNLQVPPTTPTLTDVKSVFLEIGTGCLVQGDEGKLICWGANSKGLVGDGQSAIVSFANRKTIFASGATNVAIGSDNTCAVVDANLYCWGDMTTKLVGVASSVVLPRTVFGLSN